MNPVITVSAENRFLIVIYIILTNGARVGMIGIDNILVITMILLYGDNKKRLNRVIHIIAAK